MKNEKHGFYFKIGMNGLLIVCGGIFFYYILFHSDRLSDLISRFFSILTPILAGIVIAYILNPIMRFLETRVFFPVWNRIKPKKDHTYKKEAKIIRVICAFLTLIFFLAIIYGLVIMLVPQLTVNIQSILKRIPVYLLNWDDYYASFLTKHPQIESLLKQYIGNISEWFYSKIEPYFEELIKSSSTSLLGSIITIFKSVLNFVIGLIISMYLLIDKERFIAQSKKTLYAFLKREKANNFINNLRYSDKIFGGFITAKVIDSFIIGVICYIGMLILRLPYPALIAVVVGITNVIPYFGPFIGAIPSGLIILMVDPKKCLIFVIFVLILQQFDGNILGPKILGSSTGLNSFWVIFSVTIFSGLFGFPGMFLGVPVFAVIYAALKTVINKRLEIKHMPVDTGYYIKSDFLPDEDGVTNTGKSFRFAKKTFDKVTQETYQEDLDRESTLTNRSDDTVNSVERLLNEKDDKTEE